MLLATLLLSASLTVLPTISDFAQPDRPRTGCRR